MECVRRQTIVAKLHVVTFHTCACWQLLKILLSLQLFYCFVWIHFSVSAPWVLFFSEPLNPSCFSKSVPAAALIRVYFVFVCVTEASYTLLLYDELLEWSDRPLREFLNYPMQSEWQRKEYLHLTIVQNFDRGKVSLSTQSFFFFSSHSLFLYITLLTLKQKEETRNASNKKLVSSVAII